MLSEIIKAFAKRLLKKELIKEVSKEGTGDSNIGLVSNILSQGKDGNVEGKENQYNPKVDLGRIPIYQNQFNRMTSGDNGELPMPISQQSTIPEQYRGMVSQDTSMQQNTQRPDVGFLRGMINATTGQPQPEGLNDVSQGRRTAYYSGGLLPNIIMSKLGQPSPAEASMQQALLNQRQNMSQQVFDPETGQFLYSKPKGSVFKPPSLENKANISIKTEAQKNLDTYSNDATQALTALGKIEDYGSKLPFYGRGALNQTSAKISSSYGKYAKDKDITRYEGVIAQEMIPMARKLMEEKGPITEFDVARIEKGFGEITTPFEDKIALISEFKNKVKQALLNKMQVAGLSEVEFANRYPGLYKSVFQEETNQIQEGWSMDKESRYQELLRKRGQ